MANEQQIRISARGEFSQLQRGLEELQRNLAEINRTVDDGARRGGIFDESQVGALDLFRRRFSETTAQIERDMERQRRAVRSLQSQLASASQEQRNNLRTEIQERTRLLRLYRQQLDAARQTEQSRGNEASQYRTQNNPAPSNSPNFDSLGGGTAETVFKGFMGSKIGFANMGLGFLGVGSLGGLLNRAYQESYQRQVESLDLSQRIRGQAGFSGKATDIYDSLWDAGMRDKLGYMPGESLMFQDVYSSQAGALNANSQYKLMKFGRAYGLSAPEVADYMGGLRQSGVADTTKFANQIAGAVSESSMTPRIVEVIQVSNQLLSQMNHSLKDTDAGTIVAYQTILDKLGNQNNMMKLTGQQGSEIIGGLGGIFDQNQDEWKWMGIRALQNYDPAKYGKMGLYGLERTFESGLMNADNLPAMTNYIKDMTGGDEETIKRVIQKWLLAGGKNLNKKGVDELYEVTRGFTVFNESSVDGVIKKNQSADSGAMYDTDRIDELGQKLLDLETRFSKSLTNAGDILVESVSQFKEAIVLAAESLNDIIGKVDAVEQYTGGFGVEDAMVVAGASAATFSAAKGIKDWNNNRIAAKTPPAPPAPPTILGPNGQPIPNPNPNPNPPKSPMSGVKFGGIVAGSLALVGTGAMIAPGMIEDMKAMVQGDAVKANFQKRLQYNSVAMNVSQQQKGAQLFEEYAKNPTSVTEKAFTSFVDPFSKAAKKITEDQNRMIYQGMKIGDEFKVGTKTHKGKIWGGYDTEGNPILYDKKDWQKIQKQQEGPDKGDANIGKSPLDDFVEIGQKHFQETEKNAKSYNETQEKNSKKSMGTIEKIHREVMSKIGKLHADFKIKADSTFNRLIKHVEGDNSKNLPDYFANWSKRITGYFGEPRGNKQHWGLDIDGEQGDKLPALSDGTVTEIFSDPKNLTPGGSYVKVKMPSGESYSYHHLSSITSGLKRGQKVKKGDILGLMGGEEGLPGSGTSTTGSHLHLQYYDSKGVKQDPENFMLDMGLNGYSSGTKYVPKTQIALVHKGEAIIPESLNPFVSGNQQSSSSSNINIKLTIDGNGAQNLSNLQISTFEKVAKQVFEQAMKNNLMVNPVKLRW